MVVVESVWQHIPLANELEGHIGALDRSFAVAKGQNSSKLNLDSHTLGD